MLRCGKESKQSSLFPSNPRYSTTLQQSVSMRSSPVLIFWQLLPQRRDTAAFRETCLMDPGGVKILNKMPFFLLFAPPFLNKQTKKDNKNQQKHPTQISAFPQSKMIPVCVRTKGFESGFSPFTSCACPFYQWFCWFLQGSGRQRSCTFCLLFLMLHLGSSGRMSWQRRWQHSQSHVWSG